MNDTRNECRHSTASEEHPLGEHNESPTTPHTVMVRMELDSECSEVEVIVVMNTDAFVLSPDHAKELAARLVTWLAENSDPCHVVNFEGDMYSLNRVLVGSIALALVVGATTGMNIDAYSRAMAQKLGSDQSTALRDLFSHSVPPDFSPEGQTPMAA